MLDISGKRALITGASRGIGRQIALGLSQLGCHLILHSRQLEHTRELAAELETSGVDIKQVAADMSDDEAMESLITELQSGPPIDILYNNAAIMLPWQEDAWSITPESLSESFQVNVISQVRLCNALVPNMISRGFGRIVNLVSDIDQLPNLAPYAVTKAALEKYTHDIGPALGDSGVRMYSLNPGWLKTDMGSEEAPNEVESVMPGALVPLMVEQAINGHRFEAQEYAGVSLQQAVSQAEAALSELHGQKA